MYQRVDFEELVGKTLTKVEQTDMFGDKLSFYCDDGIVFHMYHDQDCCENVSIEDLNGEFEDIINTPILEAFKSINSEDDPLDDWEESFTWTFYRIATVKGYLNIRWYGSSNGYYSESVDIYKESPDPMGSSKMILIEKLSYDYDCEADIYIPWKVAVNRRIAMQFL